jgi:hypothetical protein
LAAEARAAGADAARRGAAASGATAACIVIAITVVHHTPSTRSSSACSSSKSSFRVGIGSSAGPAETTDRYAQCQTGADANEDGILDHCQFAAGDLDLDGVVGAKDLVLVLNDWGTEGHDANGDGIVDGFDLAAILSNWTL